MDYAYQFIDSLILCMIIMCMCIWIYEKIVTLEDRRRKYYPEEFKRKDVKMMEYSYRDLVVRCKGRYEISDRGMTIFKIPRYKIINRRTHRICIGSVDFLCRIVDEENREIAESRREQEKGKDDIDEEIKLQFKRDRLAEEMDRP